MPFESKLDKQSAGFTTFAIKNGDRSRDMTLTIMSGETVYSLIHDVDAPPAEDGSLMMLSLYCGPDIGEAMAAAMEFAVTGPVLDDEDEADAQG